MKGGFSGWLEGSEGRVRKKDLLFCKKEAKNFYFLRG
jgi:hypothetical protein